MANDPKWNPSEEQIARVLETTGSDPRKLAIAYLRAQRRAQQNHAAFKVLADLSEAQTAAFMGDGKGAAKALHQATRDMRAAAQQFEEDKTE